MNHVMILDLLTVIALIAGLFFMLVGAVGVLRLPDVYLRMIAATKCITVGISGMLLAAVFHFVAVGTSGDPTVAASAGSSAVAASTKAILVILFQFVAGPIGTYMLARSAHVARARMWEGTLSDDLADDTTPPPQQ